MIEFKLLINGSLVAGDASMPVINPATEVIIAQCPRASERQLNEAVAAAKIAFPKWAATPYEERRKALLRIADRIDQHQAELAHILTQEQGKPLPDAAGEVAGMAGFFRYFASLELPIKIIEDSAERKVETHQMPLGVIAAIVPWNFPLLLAAFKIPPALLTGNTLVLKPAPTTPLATLKFGELIVDLLPPGVLNIVADANDLGDLITKHPDIRKIAFTGSTATGQKVMANAASTLKRITLELGGNDPAIVLDDADPQVIAPAIFQAAFWNSGQVCLGLKRLYVHDSLYEPMVSALAALAKAAVVGDGMNAGVQLGPLQNKAHFEKVSILLENARVTGTVVVGGGKIDRPGYFIHPTVVRDITDGARLVDEEQFAPILPVIRYTDLDEVIKRANNTNFGLGASVWSSNAVRAREVALRLEAGTVWINKHIDVGPHIAFGGAKHSGIGVELGNQGLFEYTQLKVINMGPSS